MTCIIMHNMYNHAWVRNGEQTVKMIEMADCNLRKVMAQFFLSPRSVLLFSRNAIINYTEYLFFSINIDHFSIQCPWCNIFKNNDWNFSDFLIFVWHITTPNQQELHERHPLSIHAFRSKSGWCFHFKDHLLIWRIIIPINSI